MSELAIAVIAASIALVGVIIGAVLQHFLSLRADRIKRERDLQEVKAEELRETLVEGIRGGSLVKVKLKEPLIDIDEPSTKIIAHHRDRGAVLTKKEEALIMQILSEGLSESQDQEEGQDEPPE